MLNWTNFVARCESDRDFFRRVQHNKLGFVLLAGAMALAAHFTR